MVMPKYETKTEWTATQIRDSILRGQVLPGDRMRIQEWSRRLAVSATPIREALKALEAEGYVRISPHRGAEVTAFSSKEFSDSYRINMVLDSLAAEFATARLSGSEKTSACKRMYNINDELRAALKAGNARAAERLNTEFHKAIYTAADSPLLSRAKGPLWGGIPVAGMVFWEMVAESPNWTDDLCSEHDAIVKAIEDGDRQQAIRLTREHLEQGVKRLSEIDARQDETADAAGSHRGARKQRSRAPAVAG